VDSVKEAAAALRHLPPSSLPFRQAHQATNFLLDAVSSSLTGAPQWRTTASRHLRAHPPIRFAFALRS